MFSTECGWKQMKINGIWSFARLPQKTTALPQIHDLLPEKEILQTHVDIDKATLKWWSTVCFLIESWQTTTANWARLFRRGGIRRSDMGTPGILTSTNQPSNHQPYAMTRTLPPGGMTGRVFQLGGRNWNKAQTVKFAPIGCMLLLFILILWVNLICAFGSVSHTI